MTIRAHFDGKVFIPDQPVHLARDQSVELEVRESKEETPTPGSKAALLRILDREPPIPAEDVAELERAIEEGELPVRDAGAFDDER